ncbi:integrase arm-type DNA-binding domain-containing protein [Methylobacter sp. S3L5C]|uniref:tyrosine-type recombinase/integrase n=1 Tax=Methylobacter sp. S3L5C TaxID=2839024 RepID=UPI001FAC24DE|nr:integrase arm-type DNA-binding domain-containing protein [Methylobacter sp. S3L5C]UOA07138.1 integrase arm-type DNA-binding domain-containing protein [Methylobacter sp. S3L5C]
MAKDLLKDVTIRNAKLEDKDKRLNDGEGLYILVKSNGAKWWRFDYTSANKRKTLSLGVYPATGLSDARVKAREAIAKGIDPSDTRKEEKAIKQLATENIIRADAGLPILNSFEHITREWLASTTHLVREITHSKKIRRFEVHVFPVIGGMPINAVKSPDIFSLIKPLFNRLETAHRVCSDIAAAFGYAIAHGFTDYDPAQAVATQIPAQKAKHRAALTEPKDVAQLLRDIGCYQGTFVVQCAFRFLFTIDNPTFNTDWLRSI